MSDLHQAYSPLSLDSNFAKLRSSIASRCKILDKTLRVKVVAWLTKLAEESDCNVVHKKNRNAYTRLLLEQLKAGRLEEPFLQMPPPMLATFNKALLYPYSKPKITPSPHSRPSPAYPSPSQELDHYLWRQIASPPPSSLPPQQLHDQFTFQPTTVSYAVRDPETTGAASDSGLRPEPIEMATPISEAGSGWQPHGSGDGDAAGSSENYKAPQQLSFSYGGHGSAAAAEQQHQRHQTELELRLVHAEEMLRQQGQLLMLSLSKQLNSSSGVSGAEAQPGGATAGLDGEGEGSGEWRTGAATTMERLAGKPQQQQQQQHRRQRSVEEVLLRAESKRGNAAGGNRHEQGWGDRGNSSGSNDALLRQRMEEFGHGTATLRARLEGLEFRGSGGGAGDSAPVNASKLGHILPLMPAATNAAQSLGEGPCRPRLAARATKLPPRETLKSAAAAAAVRRLAGEGNASGRASLPPPPPPARRVAALLAPRPGSIAELISEVAALRKRLASNLAAMESTGGGGRSDFSSSSGLVFEELGWGDEGGSERYGARLASFGLGGEDEERWEGNGREGSLSSFPPSGSLLLPLSPLDSPAAVPVLSSLND